MIRAYFNLKDLPFARNLKADNLFMFDSFSEGGWFSE